MTQMIEQIQNAMLPNTQHFNAIVSPEYCSTKSAMDSDGSCHSAYVPYTARAAVNTLDTTMNDIFTCAAYCRIAANAPHTEKFRTTKIVVEFVLKKQSKRTVTRTPMVLALRSPVDPHTAMHVLRTMMRRCSDASLTSQFQQGNFTTLVSGVGSHHYAHSQAQSFNVPLATVLRAVSSMLAGLSACLLERTPRGLRLHRGSSRVDARSAVQCCVGWWCWLVMVVGDGW